MSMRKECDVCRFCNLRRCACPFLLGIQGCLANQQKRLVDCIEKLARDNEPRSVPLEKAQWHAKKHLSDEYSKVVGTQPNAFEEFLVRHSTTFKVIKRKGGDNKAVVRKENKGYEKADEEARLKQRQEVHIRFCAENFLLDNGLEGSSIDVLQGVKTRWIDSFGEAPKYLGDLERALRNSRDFTLWGAKKGDFEVVTLNGIAVLRRRVEEHFFRREITLDSLSNVLASVMQTWSAPTEESKMILYREGLKQLEQEFGNGWKNFCGCWMPSASLKGHALVRYAANQYLRQYGDSSVADLLSGVQQFISHESPDSSLIEMETMIIALCGSRNFIISEDANIRLHRA
eukprot:TRINITY_DN9041_c0_g1_i1.p1 TRINITY_DN9041_c0_g1~~TRINITY_DN9041_c0_g1_i1.p1  ORF type:complete len:361 (+),score=38.59 TRINITY_DN9041_c0_g1_i1:53-1084(+)